MQAHPLVHEIVAATEQAVDLGDLAEALFPEPPASPVSAGEDERVAFLTHVVAALSHVRATVGRAALSVDLHLWVRELTRINRAASSTTRYLWSDDGALTDPAHADAGAGQHAFPAIYCRHCGRSGWGIGLAAVGANLDADDTAIRRNHATQEGRFRALLYAPLEADHAAVTAGKADGKRAERGGAALVLHPPADAAPVGPGRGRSGLPRRLDPPRAHPGRPGRRRRIPR